MFPNKKEYTDLIIIIKLFHTEKKSDFFLFFLTNLVNLDCMLLLSSICRREKKNPPLELSSKKTSPLLIKPSTCHIACRKLTRIRIQKKLKIQSITLYKSRIRRIKTMIIIGKIKFFPKHILKLS